MGHFSDFRSSRRPRDLGDFPWISNNLSLPIFQPINCDVASGTLRNIFACLLMGGNSKFDDEHLSLSASNPISGDVVSGTLLNCFECVVIGGNSTFDALSVDGSCS